MITLSYSEVKKVCEVETQNLVDKKKLKEHCEKHNLSYHGVLTFLRGDLRRKRNVKLMISFLKSVGYEEVSSERLIIYNFHFKNTTEELLEHIKKTSS